MLRRGHLVDLGGERGAVPGQAGSADAQRVRVGAVFSRPWSVIAQRFPPRPYRATFKEQYAQGSPPWPPPWAMRNRGENTLPMTAIRVMLCCPSSLSASLFAHHGIGGYALAIGQGYAHGRAVLRLDACTCAPYRHALRRFQRGHRGGQPVHAAGDQADGIERHIVIVLRCHAESKMFFWTLVKGSWNQMANGVFDTNASPPFSVYPLISKFHPYGVSCGPSGPIPKKGRTMVVWPARIARDCVENRYLPFGTKALQ